MFDRGSGEGRNNRENRQVVSVQEDSPAFIHDLDDADRLTLPLLEGDRDHVMGDGPRRLIDFFEVAAIHLSIRDDFRLSGPIHGSGDALVPRHGGTVWNRLLTDRMIEHEGMFLLVR